MNDLLIALLAVVIVWAVYHTVKKYRKGSGCCGEHQAMEKKVRVTDRIPSHYPYLAALKIGGMTCENCSRRVENALNRMDGIWATVSLSGGTAVVRSKTPPDETMIREAVRKAGYVVMEYKIIG